MLIGCGPNVMLMVFYSNALIHFKVHRKIAEYDDTQTHTHTAQIYFGSRERQQTDEHITEHTFLDLIVA